MHTRQSILALIGFNLLLLVPGLALVSEVNRPGQPLVSGPLGIAWTRQEAVLEPAWPDQPRFTSDAAYKPVLAGSLALYTSSRHDQLIAVETSTGQVRWRFTAEGPIRFAPAVWQDRAYCVSDDGFLYCVDLESGELLWKFRGGPAERRILGNERVISTWPARGAPAVAVENDEEATVYFAAGIWPFMGIFLHALDARSGEPRWQNSGDGSMFIKQPHQTDAFAGFAPQGQIVVVGDRLLIPCGRSIPACYDRHTGRVVHYRLADASKLGGGPDIVADGQVYFNGGGAFDGATGGFLGLAGEPLTVADGMLYSVIGTTCRVFDLGNLPEAAPPADPKDKKKKPVGENWLGQPVASFAIPRTTVMRVAGKRLFGAGAGVVYAVDLPIEQGRAPRVWKAALDGTAAHLDSDGQRLIVSTREGRLVTFDSETRSGIRHRLETVPLPAPTEAEKRRVQRILAAAPVREGYAVVLGGESAGFVGAILKQTRLNLLILEPDADRAENLRERLRQAGIDGKRAAVLGTTLERAALPPYLASVVIADGPKETGWDAAGLDRVWEKLRPYGGVAVLPSHVKEGAELGRWSAARSKEEAVQQRDKEGLVALVRAGALPGAGDWTHQHADAANTRVSRDSRVKAPLGLLWFGGPGHQGILPRHGHGPVPQVCEGRLFIEGPDKLRAIDIYTGRLLWETALPGVGQIYDNTAHQPGANAAGSNYVSTPEGVYVAYREQCLRLDPATGKTVQRIQLPSTSKKKAAPAWSFLTVAGEYLIGGDGPLGMPVSTKKNAPIIPSASRRLTVLDRRTGKVRFTITAKHGFRHNSICVGGGRLYAIDRALDTDPKKKKSSEKTEERKPIQGRVVAHDLQSGKALWSSDRDVFGTWLSYSAAHDVLVEAGLMSRDTLLDEPSGMRAYRGADGKALWYNRDYFGPGLIHGDRILKGGDARGGSGTACHLLTGKPVLVPDPLTGQAMEWKWVRTYGCNTPAASEHLVLFRSGSAGYFDLSNEGGTGNLGGFRSSCTLNMMAAGGVLTVPDYTRTCTCSYQNQCSVGLVTMPEVEMWTFTTSRPITGTIRRLGVNLGAPGSRKDEGGTLWLEYPAVGGPSPKVAISSKPTRPDQFRVHSSQVEGKSHRWVGASGVRGLEQLRITIDAKSERSRGYTVRLYFLEPETVEIGARRFNVRLQGREVLKGFDVREQAGSRNRLVVREFPGIQVKRELTIELTPEGGESGRPPILSGVEVVQSDSDE